MLTHSSRKPALNSTIGGYARWEDCFLGPFMLKWRNLPPDCLTLPRVTRSPRPFCFVFAYYKQSKTGDGNGLYRDYCVFTDHIRHSQLSLQSIYKCISSLFHPHMHSLTAFFGSLAVWAEQERLHLSETPDRVILYIHVSVCKLLCQWENRKQIWYFISKISQAFEHSNPLKRSPGSHSQSVSDCRHHK